MKRFYFHKGPVQYVTIKVIRIVLNKARRCLANPVIIILIKLITTYIRTHGKKAVKSTFVVLISCNWEHVTERHWYTGIV